MKRQDPWMRLAAAARRAPEEAPSDLPLGFATRVAARGLAAKAESPDFFAVFARRALGVALAVAITSAAISVPRTTSADNSADQDDPVEELVSQL